MLTEIIHKYAEESISEEQVQRVIAPVIARIAAGEFSRVRQLNGAVGIREIGDERDAFYLTFLKDADWEDADREEAELKKKQNSWTWTVTDIKLVTVCEGELKIIWRGMDIQICQIK